MMPLSPIAELEDTAIYRLGSPYGLSRIPEDIYEMRVFMKCRDLSESFGELEHVLELLQAAKSFTEIRLLLKFYIVSWVSLSDVLAHVVNEVYELGYAPQDVAFQVLLRNRRLTDSPLHGILKVHRKSIKYDEYVKIRNELVHRGQFEAPALDELEGEWAQALAQRLRHVDPANKEATRAAAKEARESLDLGARAKSLLAKEERTMAAHLTATRVFLSEVATALAKVVNERSIT